MPRSNSSSYFGTGSQQNGARTTLTVDPAHISNYSSLGGALSTATQNDATIGSRDSRGSRHTPLSTSSISPGQPSPHSYASSPLGSSRSGPHYGPPPQFDSPGNIPPSGSSNAPHREMAEALQLVQATSKEHIDDLRSMIKEKDQTIKSLTSQLKESRMSHERAHASLVKEREAGKRLQEEIQRLQAESLIVWQWSHLLFRLRDPNSPVTVQDVPSAMGRLEGATAALHDDDASVTGRGGAHNVASSSVGYQPVPSQVVQVLSSSPIENAGLTFEIGSRRPRIPAACHVCTSLKPHCPGNVLGWSSSIDECSTKRCPTFLVHSWRRNGCVLLKC